MFKYLVLFLFGGTLYMGIETWYDNTSHRSMGLVGGISFIVCGELFALSNLSQDIRNPLYWLICLVIAVIITTLEYIAGNIWNKNYTIWDYRKMKFNIKGQICLTFFLIWWLGISHLIIYLYPLISKVVT